MKTLVTPRRRLWRRAGAILGGRRCGCCAHTSCEACSEQNKRTYYFQWYYKNPTPKKGNKIVATKQQRRLFRGHMIYVEPVTRKTSSRIRKERSVAGWWWALPRDTTYRRNSIDESSCQVRWHVTDAPLKPVAFLRCRVPIAGHVTVCSISKCELELTESWN